MSEASPYDQCTCGGTRYIHCQTLPHRCKFCGCRNFRLEVAANALPAATLADYKQHHKEFMEDPNA